jgi:SAM-dependent methyltransferase
MVSTPNANVANARAGASARPCEVCGGPYFDVRFHRLGRRYERCRDCGLERTEPAPSDADLAQIYGRHYYDAWGLSGGGDDVRAMKKGTFRRVLAAAGPLPPGARVLDCGAATGFLMEVVREAGHEPYGIELSAFGAERIAERFGAERVFQGDIEDAHFALVEEGRFAAIFMCDYLEHVRDPARVLRRAADWLQPGAPLVITTPRIGSLTQRVMGSAWSHYKTEHLYYFAPNNLRMLLVQTGFEVVRTKAMRKNMTAAYVYNYFATYHHPVFSPLARLLRRLPQRLRDYDVGLIMGEMLVVARRTGAQPVSSRAARATTAG